MSQDANPENPLTMTEKLLQEAAVLNAAYPGMDINSFNHLLDNALAALEISLNDGTPPMEKAEESRTAAELLEQAGVQAEQIPWQLAAVPLPEVKAGFPAELQHGIRFYAEVTPEQYLRLTGDADSRQLKERLAMERESA